MREWERGKQMSDSPTHPSALALSCTKPARLQKRRESRDGCRYIKVKDDMKQKKWRHGKMQRLTEDVQKRMLRQ